MQTMQPQMETLVPTEATMGPLQQVQDLALGLYVHAQTALVARNYNVAENWENLSSLRRVAHSVGRLAGNTFGLWLASQGARAGGLVAQSLDDIPFLDLPSVHAARQPKVVAQEAEPAAQPMLLAQIPETVEVREAPARAESFDLASDVTLDRPNPYRYDFELPVDRDRAPESLPLGEWEKKTGHGTVWNQTLAYADELGFANLTEPQKRQATQRILDFNGLTWAEARRLGPAYEPKMPTQRVMEGWLTDIGADRTDVADRPVLPPPSDPGPGTGPDPDCVCVDARPPDRDDCNRPGWITWFPWLDCEANRKDWYLALIVGLLAAGAAGQAAISKSRRRRAAAPVVVGPPAASTTGAPYTTTGPPPDDPTRRRVARGGDPADPV